MSAHIAFGQFGPVYPALKGADKFRRIARRDGGLLGMDGADVMAYGRVVLTDILRLQRTELAREAPPVSNRCYASGTAYAGGGEILAAIRRQHKAETARRGPARTDDELRAAYDAAMRAKREAAKIIAAPLATFADMCAL